MFHSPSIRSRGYYSLATRPRCAVRALRVDPAAAPAFAGTYPGMRRKHALTRATQEDLDVVAWYAMAKG